ncbi:MAG TPA: hypothetical protein VMV78_12725 [Thiobacillus sp.]|jgi:hypothetical protein|nr:hypothetical protein [Thiobacillus sp.]
MSHDSMPHGSAAAALPAFKAIDSLNAPARTRRWLNIPAGRQ